MSLPPLPEPNVEYVSGHREPIVSYDAEQMQAYGQACREAALEEAAMAAESGFKYALGSNQEFEIMTTPLQQAAQAVIDRWDSPLWKDQPHTGVYIAELRKALEAEQAQAVEPVIDFTVLHEFADSARISYNELCTAVRLATRSSCEHVPETAFGNTERAELIARLRSTAYQDDEVRAHAREAADMLEADTDLRTQLARRTVERDMAIGMAAGVEAQQALSLDLLERLSKTLTRLGYSTPEGGMEHFGAQIESQLYNLCRGVDSILAQQVAVPVPMTEDEIFDLWRDGDTAGGATEFEATVRVIEAHHGIKAKPDHTDWSAA